MLCPAMTLGFRRPRGTRDVMRARSAPIYRPSGDTMGEILHDVEDDVLVECGVGAMDHVRWKIHHRTGRNLHRLPPCNVGHQRAFDHEIELLVGVSMRARAAAGLLERQPDLNPLALDDDGAR